jgi:hypothetical protein
VSEIHGAVAQVDHDADAEIGDVHNRVLSAFEHLSRQIRHSETGLRIAEGTYATAPHKLDTLGAQPRLVVRPRESGGAPATMAPLSCMQTSSRWCLA